MNVLVYRLVVGDRASHGVEYYVCLRAWACAYGMRVLVCKSVRACLGLWLASVGCRSA